MRHIWITGVAILVLAGTTLAATITVPGDYATIQEAVNAASNGDVIEIAAGIYYPTATINTLGKAVTLRGVPGNGKDGAPTTVIDGQDSIQVLICESDEGADTVFENLVIQNGFHLGLRWRHVQRQVGRQRADARELHILEQLSQL